MLFPLAIREALLASNYIGWVERGARGEDQHECVSQNKQTERKRGTPVKFAADCVNHGMKWLTRTWRESSGIHQREVRFERLAL
jgi:hypothetical protein